MSERADTLDGRCALCYRDSDDLVHFVAPGATMHTSDGAVIPTHRHTLPYLPDPEIAYLIAERDEARADAMERDVDLNAFLRFCVDELGMYEPAAFSYRDGYEYIRRLVDGAAIALSASEARLEAAEGKVQEQHQIVTYVHEMGMLDGPCPDVLRRLPTP